MIKWFRRPTKPVKGDVTIPIAADVYVTEWGSFRMPDGLAKRTRWLYVEGSTYLGMRVVREADPTVDNHEFFTWLHNEEVKAGKPSKPGHFW
jgi:hypothetical protein